MHKAETLDSRILARHSEENLMKKKITIPALLALAFVLLTSQFGVSADDEAYSVPLKTVPTFSTANIGRQGHFYVGGKWVGELGKQRMRGAMFVEVWVPKKIRHPYPILFVQAGGGQTTIGLLQTPDCRPGWTYNFVNPGHTISIM